jgi:hypothetical protein
MKNHHQFPRIGTTRGRIGRCIGPIRQLAWNGDEAGMLPQEKQTVSMRNRKILSLLAFILSTFGATAALIAAGLNEPTQPDTGRISGNSLQATYPSH